LFRNPDSHDDNVMAAVAEQATIVKPETNLIYCDYDPGIEPFGKGV